MARFWITLVLALALALSSAFPVEEVPKEPVDADKISEPVVDEKLVSEPEVHEPVPAEPIPSEPVSKLSETPQEAPLKELAVPVEEALKEEVPVGFEGYDADRSGYIDVSEWQIRADDSRKDKFDQVDVDDDSRISPEEFKGLTIPEVPQENVNDVFVPDEVAGQPVDRPADVPEEVSAPVGRSAESDIVLVPEAEVAAPVVAEGFEPLAVVSEDDPNVPVLPAEPEKPVLVVEPIAAASDEDAVAVVDDVLVPVQPVADGTIVEDFKPVVVEERSDSLPEDVEDQVSEQKDPVLSDEVKSEEVKSEEAKSGESKSDEVKSEEVVSEEVKSVASRSDEGKSELSRSEENKSEDVKSEVSKSDEVKSEELKPVEDKVQDVPKIEDLKSGEVVKEEVKPEVIKKPVEESAKAPQEKVKEEDKVKEETKVVEAVKVEEPVKVEEGVKKADATKDLSPSNQIRV